MIYGCIKHYQKICIRNMQMYIFKISYALHLNIQYCTLGIFEFCEFDI